MQRENGGEWVGLTIVGVQQRQGALSAPIHPSLRANQRKKDTKKGEQEESVRENVNCEVKRQQQGRVHDCAGENG